VHVCGALQQSLRERALSSWHSLVPVLVSPKRLFSDAALQWSILPRRCPVNCVACDSVKAVRERTASSSEQAVALAVLSALEVADKCGVGLIVAKLCGRHRRLWMNLDAVKKATLGAPKPKCICRSIRNDEEHFDDCPAKGPYGLPRRGPG